MAVLSCSTAHSSIRLVLHSSAVTISSAPCSSNSTSFIQMISRPIFGERMCKSSAIGGNSYRRVCAVNPCSTSSAQLGNWEDPDGSDSEMEDELEGEENNLDFESDWEEETDASQTSNNIKKFSTSQIEENLIKEVEELLTPEELAILQQNDAPDIDKISTEKWNPLHTLALAGQIKFMDNLLENGFDIDAVDTVFDPLCELTNPRETTRFAGSPESSQVNLRGHKEDGQTALHKAVLGKKEAVISHLLRKGASPHVQDRDGATPLHYAVQVSAMQTVKLLIKSKVDVNVADNEGWTPLHIAMQSRNRDIAKVLLVNGADKTRRTEDGKTPLDIGLCYGKEFKAYDLAKLLKIVPANRYV